MHIHVMYIYTYTHTYIHTYIHPSIHPSIHPYIHTYIGDYIDRERERERDLLRYIGGRSALSSPNPPAASELPSPTSEPVAPTFEEPTATAMATSRYWGGVFLKIGGCALLVC